MPPTRPMTPRKISTLGPGDILRSRYTSERAPSSRRTAAEAVPGAETENDKRVEMTGMRQREGASATARTSPLIYRHFLWTRITHWTWAITLFFLLLSGLQIFNAHPTLYVGKQSGFGFDNAVLAIGAENTPYGPVGYTRILGVPFDTTGVLGLSGNEARPSRRGFPAWATIPSYRDLGTGRVVHSFFAWVLVITLLGWLAGSLINGHLQRDLAPRRDDLRKLPRDIVNHARLRFHHT